MLDNDSLVTIVCFTVFAIVSKFYIQLELQIHRSKQQVVVLREAAKSVKHKEEVLAEDLLSRASTQSRGFLLPEQAEQLKLASKQHNILLRQIVEQRRLS